MSKHIGLWIDHERAVIVFPTPDGEETKVILCDADRPSARVHGDGSTAAIQAPQTLASDAKDRKLAGHLKQYYDEVIDCVHEAGSLLVFGPGEAKGELAKRLSQQKPTMRSVNVKPADKMTYREIAAKVLEHFGKASPVVRSPRSSTKHASKRGAHPMAPATLPRLLSNHPTTRMLVF